MPITQPIQTPKYSQFIILVCNIPDEKYLQPYQKAIISGITEKAKKNGFVINENFHIIYLDPNDSIYASKFAPLSRCDDHSRVYIIGHCRPGSDAISSDPVYSITSDNSDNSPSTSLIETNQNLKKESRNFKYDYIAKILIANITHPNILFDRNNPPDSLNSILQHLRVCVPSCWSGVDKTIVDPNGNQRILKSFVSRLFDFLANEMTKKTFKCDVIGNKGFVVPLPTNDSLFSVTSFIDLMRTIFNIEFKATDFHKRHMSVEDNKLYTIFPRHQPSGVDYKVSIVFPLKVNESDLKEGLITGDILNTKEVKVWSEIQFKAEKILRLCDVILGNTENEYVSKIRNKILTGDFQSIDAKLLKELNEVEEKLQTMIAPGQEFEP